MSRYTESTFKKSRRYGFSILENGKEFSKGFAMTRQGARQLVNHGHILVNGKKIDIPSYQVKPGDVLEVKEQMKKNDKVLEALTNNEATVEYVKVDKKAIKGEFSRLPERTELNNEINEALIVE
ncbi:hypothetical protein FQA39_LY12945 [Lamprigera yunnana]|nr:hypothetical protein FQA39_LY12945 [Lamprigera yunnana]